MGEVRGVRVGLVGREWVFGRVELCGWVVSVEIRTKRGGEGENDLVVYTREVVSLSLFFFFFPFVWVEENWGADASLGNDAVDDSTARVECHAPIERPTFSSLYNKPSLPKVDESGKKIVEIEEPGTDLVMFEVNDLVRIIGTVGEGMYVGADPMVLVNSMGAWFSWQVVWGHVTDFLGYGSREVPRRERRSRPPPRRREAPPGSVQPAR